jgi:putative transcriptional regulator
MSKHAPTELLADYAAGSLPPGMRLLVASHLSFCTDCRDRAARIEAIGGALLAECRPVAPSGSCLARALARIARCGTETSVAGPGDEPVPEPLRLRLPSPFGALPWRPLLPGLTECRLDGFPSEAVGLMRARPGTRMLAPGHCGREARLVLTGRLQDGGRTYARGDLALPRPDRDRCPEAAGGEPCVCLVVQPGPAPGARPPV